MNQIQNSKPPHPIPLSQGERDGVRGGHWKLILGVYLELVIWNLGFEIVAHSD